MIKGFRKLFGFKKKEKAPKYDNIADFFTHASEEEKKKVMEDAAKKANMDQLKLYKEAEQKMRELHLAPSTKQ